MNQNLSIDAAGTTPVVLNMDALHPTLRESVKALLEDIPVALEVVTKLRLSLQSPRNHGCIVLMPSRLRLWMVMAHDGQVKVWDADNMCAF